MPRFIYLDENDQRIHDGSFPTKQGLIDCIIRETSITHEELEDGTIYEIIAEHKYIAPKSQGKFKEVARY
jgi:hypothetical protein